MRTTIVARSGTGIRFQPVSRSIGWRKRTSTASRPLFANAVDGSVRDEPASIFLSGGLDSISVAVAATDNARSSGRTEPSRAVAGVPGQGVQRGADPGRRRAAARSETGTGAVRRRDRRRGLLGEALALSAASPQPIWNMWAPAYNPLAQLAAEQRTAA